MTNQERKSIEKIRADYMPNETTKFDELKNLNKKVKRVPLIFGYTFGSIGSLILGTGMCFAMKVIGNSMLFGILLGLAGIALVSMTYPLYRKILNARKTKYAKQIFALTDGLLNN